MMVRVEWGGWGRTVQLSVDVLITEADYLTMYIVTLHPVDLTEDDRLRGQTLQVAEELAQMRERVTALER